MRYNDWRLEYRPGGWVRARDHTGMTVFFRVELIGEGELSRPRVHVTLMDSPKEPISARSWRNAPFNGVEMHALIPYVRDRLARPAEIDGVEGLNDYFDRTAVDYADLSGVIPTDQLVGDDGEPAAGFTPIRAPAGRITDEFLENLAAMYLWAVRSGRAPAPVIAEAAGVPVSRVHRWVAQARKRGYLPPGIRGRAG